MIPNAEIEAGYRALVELGAPISRAEIVAVLEAAEGARAAAAPDAWRISFQGGGCSYYTEKPSVFPEASLTPLYVRPSHPGKEKA